MDKVTSIVLTEATGMTRFEIANYVANRYPLQAEMVRQHMADNPFDWPRITTIWTDMGIYSYDTLKRPLVAVREVLDWIS